MSGCWLTLAVLAHIGGLPTRATILAPAQVGEPADQSYDVQWMDGDIDPTGVFYFFYQPENVTPTAMIKDPEFVGETIGDGVEIAIMDPTNDLAWDTSLVPAGSYFIYAVTEDPPYTGLYGMSVGVVTVRHPGDPLFPAVVVLEPDGEEDSVGLTFTFTWVATGSGALTADVRVRRPGTEDPYETLASDLAMTDNGDGTQSASYDWDVSELPEGFYYAEVIVHDSGGRTHRSFSRSTMSIKHSIDAGVAEPDAGPQPDASTIADDDDDGGKPTCGCRVGGRPTSSGTAATLLLALLALAFTRRR